jgi:hypothetical protein
MAAALKEALPCLIPTIEVFMSERDIAKGSDGNAVIHEKLVAASFGVVCVTPDNLERPWLNYETGALAARLGGRTSPFLLKVPSESLLGTPLSRLQWARVEDEPSGYILVQSINGSVEGDAVIPEPTLRRLFEKFYPDLKKDLLAIEVAKVPQPPAEDLGNALGAIAFELRNMRAQLAAVSPLSASTRGVPAGMPGILRINGVDVGAAVSGGDLISIGPSPP